MMFRYDDAYMYQATPKQHFKLSSCENKKVIFFVKVTLRLFWKEVFLLKKHVFCWYL